MTIQTISDEGLTIPEPDPIPRSYDPRPFLELRVWADTFNQIQKDRIALANRLRSDAVPRDVVAELVDNYNRSEHMVKLAMVRSFRRAAPEIRAWVKTDAALGVGEHLMARLIGTIGHPVIAQPYHWEGTKENRVLIEDPIFRRNVGKLWAYCVPEGSFVATDIGQRRVEEIAEGDRLIGKDGHPHAVEEVLTRPFAGELVRISATKMLPVRLTPEHPVLVARFRQHGANHQIWTRTEMDWRRADGIQVGDYLVIPKRAVEPSAVATDEADFLGRFVGDGCTTWGKEGKYDRGRSYISFGHHEDVTPWQELARRYGAARVDALPTQQRLEFGRTAVARRLREECGVHAPNKRVPPVVWNSDVSTARAFLEGYLSADGCRIPASARWAENVRASTVSEGLALDLQLLSTRLGALPSVTHVVRPSPVLLQGRLVNQHDRFNIVWNGVDRARLDDTFHDGVKRRHREDDEFLYVPVTAVGTDPYVGTVYDFSCGGSFLVNNVVVHNCGMGDASLRRRAGMSAEEAFAAGNPRAKMLVRLISEGCIKCVGSAQGEATSAPATRGVDTTSGDVASERRSETETKTTDVLDLRAASPQDAAESLSPPGSGASFAGDAETHAIPRESSTAGNPSSPDLQFKIDDEPANETGEAPKVQNRKRSPYRDVYDNAREKYKDREDWTLGHKHNAALRIVGKTVLRDLWLVAGGGEK